MTVPETNLADQIARESPAWRASGDDRRRWAPAHRRPPGVLPDRGRRRLGDVRGRQGRIP